MVVSELSLCCLAKFGGIALGESLVVNLFIIVKCSLLELCTFLCCCCTGNASGVGCFKELLEVGWPIVEGNSEWLMATSFDSSVECGGLTELV